MTAVKHHRTVKYVLSAWNNRFMLYGLFVGAFPSVNGFKMSQNTSQCTAAVQHNYCINASLFFLFEKHSWLITGGSVCHSS